MTRISLQLIKEAYKINKLLPLLLIENRNIEASLNELKWIKNELRSKKEILNACLLRSKHYPLQYILNSQPFGPLLIKCKSKVLIPRWETEEWAMELSKRLYNIENMNKQLKILDLCTGSGCIPLLIKYYLPNCHVTALDVSKYCVNLVKENCRLLNLPLNVVCQNVFEMNLSNNLKIPAHVDILTSNPPYIPSPDFVKECSKSVKMFEPRLALVADKEFYLNLVTTWLSRTDSFVYEIGNLSQGYFIAEKIRENSDLFKKWEIGIKHDSNNKPRVVYGYKKTGTKINMSDIFKDFGQLI